MTYKNSKPIQRLVIVALVISLAPALSRPTLADDRSYSTIISHIKKNYRAKGQSFFGMVMFARFLVKTVRPAGVKNFKLTMLREVDYTQGPRPDTPHFHAFLGETIHPSWEPLIQYASRKDKQWSYVYWTREKNDAKILVVIMQQSDAFVLQFKFSPEKLAAFINNPRIMGIPLKGDERDNAAAPDQGAARPANQPSN